MKPITMTMLKQQNACGAQVSIFRDLFGDSVVPTYELALQHADTFDFDWAVTHLLPHELQKAYKEAVTPAWETYNETITSIRQERDRTTAAADKAYRDAIAAAVAAARKVLNRATDTAWEAHNGAIASAAKALNEARARTFMEAWRAGSEGSF